MGWNEMAESLSAAAVTINRREIFIVVPPVSFLHFFLSPILIGNRFGFEI
jgi:hypothetical protein